MPATFRQFAQRFNAESDAGIIAYLDSRENKTDTIRRALLAQMKAEEEETSCEV